LLFSFFSRFGSSKIVSEDIPSQDDVSPVFDDLTLLEDAVCLTNFTLFHHENHFNIDLLVFLPHYGLYLGEKILWNLQELKGASVKRFTRQNKAEFHTHLEATDKVIYQKLQDVLSFDSTPLERIFWMQNLTSSEFETLDPSFHELLPKARLIFKDDALVVQSKLHALHVYQANAFSKLKVIGSLRAHTLLLPTATEAFGSLLSPQQQLFLDAPIKTRSILSLSAAYSSGKSTVLIRKVMDYLLSNSNYAVLIITPTRLSGELLRNEFISLMEFAAVKCNLSNLHFYVPTPDTEPLETTPIFLDSSLIVCDDTHLLDPLILQRIMEHKGSRSLILCGVTNPIDTDTYALDTVYRKPILNTVHFTHTKGALFTLLTGLKTHLETINSNLIMIIVPNHETLLEYKKAIESHLPVKCRILNDTFSLQYDNLEEITLSTPEYISGLNVPHSYLINLNNHDPLYYPLALSRASDTVTIISESNLEG